MEEKYALKAQQLALLLGFVAFAVFLLMFKPILEDAPQQENIFFCGVKSSYADSGKNAEGKTLFINNCASCHSKNMHDALTGPPLYNWQDYLGNEKEFLFYIKSPSNYPKKRMNKAFKQLHNDYAPTQCVAFPSLNEADITALAAYISARCELRRIAY